MQTEEVKLFGKWSYEGVKVEDMSLMNYIAVQNAKVYVPHTAGTYAKHRFHKATCPIVERLVNSLMAHGRNNGKKLQAVQIVNNTFEYMSVMSDDNPLQTLVKAVENSGPREDSTRIGSGGVVRRQSVDVSPLRRVNQAITLLCNGARNASFRSTKTISECLADELMNAAKGSSNSSAIKKKDEIERVAKSNR
ncbi:putative 40S ribosomal protein S5 [Blattamonas nauphoetae]|uniref:40S ribosomal protein S5 n=1 Tax=Blattamonas nauphoetae TaxID=2049346 RepID=A0ABQ9YMA9_9EUKA|nr:putative 40S ribosomal protein S5 [Blattamonas nauphoetae]